VTDPSRHGRAGLEFAPNHFQAECSRAKRRPECGFFGRKAPSVVFLAKSSLLSPRRLVKYASRPRTCRNSRCAPVAVEVIVAVFPSTSACPGIPRRRIVVEIVDVSSPKFYNVQQVRFSKLLNLKTREKGGPLSPRRISGVL